MEWLVVPWRLLEGQMEAVFSREKPGAKHKGTEKNFCELTNLRVRRWCHQASFFGHAENTRGLTGAQLIAVASRDV